MRSTRHIAAARLTLSALLVGATLNARPAHAEVDPDEPPATVGTASTAVTPALEAPREAGAEFASTKSATATVAEARTSTRTPAPPVAPELTWARTAGAIPVGGGIVELGFGFSGLPRGALHHGLGGGLSLGLAAGFDIGHWDVRAAFDPGLLLALPVRWSTQLDAWRLAVRGDLGVLFARDRGASLVVDASVHVGRLVHPQWLIGALAAVPFSHAFDAGVTTVPVLVGPFAELRLLPTLGLTFEAAFGPAPDTTGRVGFGMRMMGGLVYRLY
jgi:hypothetical protein